MLSQIPKPSHKSIMLNSRYISPLWTFTNKASLRHYFCAVMVFDLPCSHKCSLRYISLHYRATVPVNPSFRFILSVHNCSSHTSFSILNPSSAQWFLLCFFKNTRQHPYTHPPTLLGVLSGCTGLFMFFLARRHLISFCLFQKKSFICLISQARPPFPATFYSFPFSFGELMSPQIFFWWIINKTFCKDKPPPLLQGQALRVLQKKSPHHCM